MKGQSTHWFLEEEDGQSSNQRHVPQQRLHHHPQRPVELDTGQDKHSGTTVLQPGLERAELAFDLQPPLCTCEQNLQIWSHIKAPHIKATDESGSFFSQPAAQAHNENTTMEELARKGASGEEVGPHSDSGLLGLTLDQVRTSSLRGTWRLQAAFDPN